MPAFLYEKSGPVAIMSFNRPEALNAINSEVQRLADEAWEDFKKDPDLQVAILTGAGDRAFCAGADLKELIPARTAAESGRRWPRNSRRFGDDIYKPIISAVNGVCVAGGMETMLGTDIRLAAEHARFGLQEPRWGLAPFAGSHVRLPRQISFCHAMELLLVGDLITAQQALQMGLINRVVPATELLSTARALAERICENGPLATRTIKEIVLRGLSMPIDQAFFLESSFGEEIFASEDAKEGPQAFSEKRKPAFKGR